MVKRKVIIVGGGLSGLSAAYELSKADVFDIHLIEKEARLGGRVSSCNINGHSVDTGGFLIYPWYKHYRELIEVLGLSHELVRIPPVGDYYDAEQNSQDKYHEGFKLSFKDIVEIFIDVFPDELIDTDPTAPKINAYKHLTIQDYLKCLGINEKKVTFYLNSTFIFHTRLRQ